MHHVRRNQRLTAIFSKRPKPGAVKTRLVPPLTEIQAADLATAMLDDVVTSLARSREFECALIGTPASELDWFRTRYADLAFVEAQHGADLGARLADFFEREFTSARHASAVVVGSDLPMLGAETVVEAHRALEAGADLVLSRDPGGGYGLIGLSRSVPELFTRVAMSTGDMAERTIAIARELSLAVAFVAECADVDVPQDLERLRVELAQSAHPIAPRTSDWLRTNR